MSNTPTVYSSCADSFSGDVSRNIGEQYLTTTQDRSILKDKLTKQLVAVLQTKVSLDHSPIDDVFEFLFLHSSGSQYDWLTLIPDLSLCITIIFRNNLFNPFFRIYSPIIFEVSL